MEKLYLDLRIKEKGYLQCSNDKGYTRKRVESTVEGGKRQYSYVPSGGRFDSSRVKLTCDLLNLETILDLSATPKEAVAARKQCDCKIIDLDSPKPDLPFVKTFG